MCMLLKILGRFKFMLLQLQHSFIRILLTFVRPLALNIVSMFFQQLIFQLHFNFDGGSHADWVALPLDSTHG